MCRRLILHGGDDDQIVRIAELRPCFLRKIIQNGEASVVYKGGRATACAPLKKGPPFNFRFFWLLSKLKSKERPANFGKQLKVFAVKRRPMNLKNQDATGETEQTKQCDVHCRSRPAKTGQEAGRRSRPLETIGQKCPNGLEAKRVLQRKASRRAEPKSSPEHLEPWRDL